MKAEQQKEDEYETSKNQKQRRRFPQNYDIAVSFLKIVVNLLLVILGIGMFVCAYMFT
jgi:hypothetical protein